MPIQSVTVLVVGTLFAAASSSGWAWSFATDVASQVDGYLRASVEADLFMGAVLVARDGKVLVSKGYGMANLEHDVPNTPQTRFNIGSVNKTFTAAAILILQDKSKLRVEDRIRLYLDDCPGAWGEITIHHLLTHTSGIPNYTDLPDYFEKKALPSFLPDALRRIRAKALEFPSGERFAYSNTGSVLLHSIIEKASGKPYPAFLQENVFTPLGMRDTGFFETPGVRHAVVKRRAAGYTDGRGPLENAPWAHFSNAGDLYATVEDLYRWDQALSTEKLLSSAALRPAFTPYKGNYGYGWFVFNRAKHPFLLHGGGTPGYALTFARYPDDQVTIVVASNLDSAPTGRIHDDLAAIVFGEKYELPKAWKAVPVDPRVYDAYVGRYQNVNEPRFVITVSKEGEWLWNRLGDDPGATTMVLRPLSETRFFNKTLVLYEVTFERNERGQVTGLVAVGP